MALINFCKTTYTSLKENYNIIVDGKRSTDEHIVMRGSFQEKEEAMRFAKTLGQLVNTQWIVAKSYPNMTKLIFHQYWLCQHANKGKKKIRSRKNANCTAKLDILIKKVTKGTKKNDEFLKQTPPLPAIINYFPNHTHSTNSADSLRMLPVNEDVKEQFFKYFSEGMTVTQAKKNHESKLLLEDNFYEILANASRNPSLHQVYYLHNVWRYGNSFKLFRKSTGEKRVCKKGTKESVVPHHPLMTVECVNPVSNNNDEGTEDGTTLLHSLESLEYESSDLNNEEGTEDGATLLRSLESLEYESFDLNYNEEETEENAVLHHPSVLLECTRSIVNEGAEKSSVLQHASVLSECTKPALHGHNMEKDEDVKAMVEELNKCAWKSCTSYVARKITEGLRDLKSKKQRQEFWNSMLMLLYAKNKTKKPSIKQNSFRKQHVGAISSNSNKTSAFCVSQKSHQISHGRRCPTVVYVSLDR